MLSSRTPDIDNREHLNCPLLPPPPKRASCSPFGGSLTRGYQHPLTSPWAKQEAPESISVGLRSARCQSFRHSLSRSKRRKKTGYLWRSAEMPKSTLKCSVEFFPHCHLSLVDSCNSNPTRSNLLEVLNSHMSYPVVHKDAGRPRAWAMATWYSG